MHPYLAHIRSNLLLMTRDRSVLVLSYVFPLIFFGIFAVTLGSKGDVKIMAQIVNMVLVLGVLGSGFFGAGMRAVQDRESGVLRRFKVTPAGAPPIIVASLISGLVAFLPTVFLIVFLSHSWMKLPLPAHPLSFLVFVSAGSLAFRALGMIVASVVNSPQESQLVTQLLYLPMLFLSGATFPLQMFPHWLQIVTQFSPSAYLFQGMQSIFVAKQDLFANRIALAALLATMLISVFLAVKLFRWEKEEKIPGRAKLWLLVVLVPFLLLGVFRAL